MTAFALPPAIIDEEKGKISQDFLEKDYFCNLLFFR